ncbi:efflux RND transporter periplasmic adaptor subunit [Piscirickettsia litoralis]|uniref:RND efflux pump membrane fusion protein barrel-sandwich domain-containing protein n=1 Tax=Piscirickettsia litoralis TaxID=1891921 RepID=A0ABX3A208_9GAMM|nr:efflux RND transporter periplasmic adaptor subunit [Piscirickettsia litoralis]ODN41663.1 hypothetical protein BGC07_00035 [Piscirickettsia litoralis]
MNVKSDATNQLVTGLVQFISPTVNTETGTIALEAEIPNKDYKLSPGMYVSVKQLLGNQHQVLVIPETAVSVNQKGASVYIIEKGIAHLVNVTLGNRDDKGNVEVLKGLKADQQVVVAGIQKLKEGVAVKVIPSAPPASATETTKSPEAVEPSKSLSKGSKDATESGKQPTQANKKASASDRHTQEKSAKPDNKTKSDNKDTK